MVRGGREASVYDLIFSDSLTPEQQEQVRAEDMKALREFVPAYCEPENMFWICVTHLPDLACAAGKQWADARPALICICFGALTDPLPHAHADGLVEMDGKKLLALDDACHYYRHPCVLDAKVGVACTGRGNR